MSGLAADVVEAREEAGEPGRVGQRLGDYLLMEEIGRGGMGVVYLARQLNLDRLVALKTTAVPVSGDPVALRRFRNEANAVGSLRHPGIVTVYETGCDSGRFFFSMELIHGAPLSKLIRERLLEPRRAAEYVRQAAEAVQHAHERGVIHRDLKPGNLLIDENQRCRVTDFGLSRRLAPDRDSELSQTELTRQGEILGTPAYMSPEQLTGRYGVVGPASDIYSLGAVLYHCLTGRPPFLADSTEATLLQVIDSEAVAARTLNPAVSSELDAICRKCLEKEPGRRYAAARDLAADLDRYLRGEPTAARPLTGLERWERRVRRNPALAALAMVSMVAVLAFVGVLVWAQVRLSEREILVRRNAYVVDMNLAQQAIDHSDFGRARELLRRHEPLSVDAPADDLRGWEWYRLREQCRSDEMASLGPNESWVAQLEFSPDGSILYSLDQRNVLKAWAVGTRSLKLSWTNLNELDSPNEMTVSPGGKWLALVGDQHPLCFIDAATLRPRGPEVVPPIYGRGLHFSQDGQRLTVYHGESEVILEVGSGKRIRERAIDGGQRFAIGHESGIVVAATGRGEVFTVGKEDGSNRPLYAHDRFVSELALNDSGQVLASVGVDGTLRILPLTESGETRVVPIGTAGRSVAISQDDSLIAVGTDGQLLKLYDVRGVEVATFRGHEAGLSRVRFSPDGRMVASADTDGGIKLWSTSARPAEARREIYPFESPPKRIAASGHFDRLLVQTVETNYLLGDPGRLAFAASLPPFGDEIRSIALNAAGARLAAEGALGGIRLYRLDGDRWVVDGVLPGNDTPVRGLAFTPDDTSLAVARYNAEVEIWDLAHGQLSGRLTHHAQRPSAWLVFSPDGRQLALGFPSGQAELLDVAQHQIVASWRAHDASVTAMQFHPKSNLLATAGGDGRIQVWRRPELSRVATLKASRAGVPSLVFSPDGRRLLAGTDEGSVRIWEIETFQEVAHLRIPGASSLYALGFSPDGETLVGCSREGVHRWLAPGYGPSKPTR